MVAVPSLEAKTPQHDLIKLLGPDEVCTPGNPVTVEIVRIGKGEDVGGGDRFQQAKANHRRGHAGREHRLGVKGAVFQRGGFKRGLTQADDLAAIQRDLFFGVGHRQAVFGLNAGGREVLQLPAIGRVWRHADIVRNGAQRRGHRAGNGDPQKGRGRPIVGALGQMAAPVSNVAALAGAGIIDRTKPVRGKGGGGRKHPEFVKQGLAQTELKPLFKRQVYRRCAEGLAVAAMGQGGGPGGVFLKRLMRGEVARRCGDARNAAGFVFGAGQEREMRLRKAIGNGNAVGRMERCGQHQNEGRTQNRGRVTRFRPSWRR